LPPAEVLGLLQSGLKRWSKMLHEDEGEAAA
jgi:hypothetical protein